MAKKLIFVSFLNNVSITGELIRTEKVYDDETEMKKVFDECVASLSRTARCTGDL